MSASRRRSTFWQRSAIAAAGFLVCLSLLSRNTSQDGGRIPFLFVTGLCFAFALLSGFWLTVDSIGGERQKGTLPLLYLTRLGRWELVLSKLAGSSLRGLYGLIGLLPVAAIPVLAGGVTGRWQWQIALMLLLTMLLSVCAGMLASAAGSNEGSAHLLTAGLIFIPVLSGALGGWALLILLLARKDRAKWSWRGRLIWAAWIFLSLILTGLLLRLANDLFPGSPAFTWMAIVDGNTTGFAASAALLALLGLSYFFGAVSLLNWGGDPGRAVARSRSGKRAKVIGDRPLEWLMWRESPASALVWIATLLTTLPYFIGVFGRVTGAVFARGFGFIMMIPAVLLAFGVARQAAHPLAAMQNSGFAEVLVTTPVAFAEIVRAQAAVFWKSMRMVLLLVIGCKLLPFLSQFYLVSGNQITPYIPLVVVHSIVNALLTIFYFAALLWVGMHFGFAKGRTALAAGLTLLLVLVAPSLLNTLAASILVSILASSGGWLIYAYPFFLLLLSMAVYYTLIRWAKRKLGVAGK